MDKLEVQQRVLQNGKPLDLDKFTWCEETRTFSSDQEGLALVFGLQGNITFNTTSECLFDTGGNCEFNTGDGCTFYVASHCTFTAGSYCNFIAGDNCNFHTGSDCNFIAASDSTFETGNRCFVVRTDIREVLELIAGKTIKLNGYHEKGYTVQEPQEDTDSLMKEIKAIQLALNTLTEKINNQK